jgi:hypothetical protein
LTNRTILPYLALYAALVLLLCAIGSPAPARAEIRNRLTAGFDSFIDRFTILEEDTAESVQEFYTGLGNDFLFSRGGTSIGLRNYFKYGNQTIDEHLYGELSLLPGSHTRMDLRTSLHYKHFQDGSDYSFGNDYIQSNTLLKLRTRLGKPVRLTLRSRLEGIDYERKTDFDYDYYYYDGGLEIEGGSILGRLVRVGGFVGFRETPDTTAMSYKRTVGDIEAQFTIGDNVFLHFTSMGDRRDYRESVRSSYWSVLSYAELMITSLTGRMITIKAESEYITYDDKTMIFYDTHFVRGSLGAKLPLREHIAITAEPRIARMICPDYAEERYFEYTITLGVEVFGREEFWLTASYEPGYRDYLSDTNNLYSDFYLNRLSLMGTIPLKKDFYVNIFAMHDPERHMRREDDFSITLISMDITKRF